MRGFTLIETLIYIALFSIVITGLIAAGYGYFDSFGLNETKAMLQEESDFIVGEINWGLSGAKTITTPLAGAQGSTLTLTKYDGTAVVIGPSGASDIALGGSILDNTNVSISNINFIHLSAPNEGVTATFKISAKTPKGQTVSQTVSLTRYVHK